jgi:hypothetical protein
MVDLSRFSTLRIQAALRAAIGRIRAAKMLEAKRLERDLVYYHQCATQIQRM